MFNLFKKKSNIQKLQDKYEKCMQEWHKFSSINRSKSDEKYAEAQEILDEIEAFKKNVVKK